MSIAPSIQHSRGNRGSREWVSSSSKASQPWGMEKLSWEAVILMDCSPLSSFTVPLSDRETAVASITGSDRRTSCRSTVGEGALPLCKMVCGKGGAFLSPSSSAEPYGGGGTCFPRPTAFPRAQLSPGNWQQVPLTFYTRTAHTQCRNERQTGSSSPTQE